MHFVNHLSSCAPKMHFVNQVKVIMVIECKFCTSICKVQDVFLFITMKTVKISVFLDIQMDTIIGENDQESVTFGTSWHNLIPTRKSYGASRYMTEVSLANILFSDLSVLHTFSRDYHHTLKIGTLMTRKRNE